jgi:phenylacetate-CoA ligase
MHIAEDHFLVEVLDPDSGAPVGDGEVGELVITSLTKECSPVLRYRTRDLSRVTRERCPCGRTSARMHKVIGRTDDMFIISGVNVFPSTVESVLLRIEGLEPHYEIVLEREGALDTFTVRVEVTEELFNGWMDDLVAFERRVSETLRSALLVRPRGQARRGRFAAPHRGQGAARDRPAAVRLTAELLPLRAVRPRPKKRGLISEVPFPV